MKPARRKRDPKSLMELGPGKKWNANKLTKTAMARVLK